MASFARHFVRFNLHSSFALTLGVDLPRVICATRFIRIENMAVNCAHPKTIVGAISEYFLGPESMDSLTELCPSASFVNIDHMGKTL